MTIDPTDRRMRQLVGEMVAVAPAAPDFESAPTEITPMWSGDGHKRTATWVAAAAVAVVVAGLVGIVATRGSDDSLSVASQGSTAEPTPAEAAPAGAAVIVDRTGEVLYRFGETAPDLELWIVDQIASELSSGEMVALGEEESERARALAEDGLTVRVALDAGLNALAVAGFEELDRRLDAAAVTVDNRTGEILSATSRSGGSLGTAQPAGSARIAIYVAALESGIGVDELIDGTGPCEVDFGDEIRSLDNYGRSDGSVAPLVDQASRASRCAEARLEAELGDAAVDVLQSTTGADVAVRVIDNPALTAVEHAGAMVAIANEGVLPDMGFVSEVLAADGRSIFRRGSSARVMNRPTATGLMTILHEIVERGTGTRAQVDGLDVAGITGSDIDFRAAWFVGTADGVTTAVWVALPDGEPMIDIGGRNVTGGSYPAALWVRIRQHVAELREVLDAEHQDAYDELQAFIAEQQALLDQPGRLGQAPSAEDCPGDFPHGYDTTGDGVIDTCYAFPLVDPPDSGVSSEVERCPPDFPVGVDTTGDGVIDTCYRN